MDANGTRFQVLLGVDDWGACTDEQDRPLGAVWAAASPADDPPPVSWDSSRLELTLRPEVFRFEAGRLDRPPRLEYRRGAGRDAYGNWYWIGPEARTVLVTSVGDGATTQFWPGRPDCTPGPRRPGSFGPVEPAPEPPPPDRLSGAAVTEDHYLVVGMIDPPGLLAFDLQTGGPPLQISWPDTKFVPFDFAPRRGGGIFVLDRENHLAWELDRHFHIVPVAVPAAGPQATFGPVGASPPAEPAFSTIEATPLGGDPIAIEAAPGGGFLILDRNSTGASLVVAYADGAQVGAAAAIEDVSLPLRVMAHDFALTPDGTLDDGTLYVVDAAGNQSYAFTLTLTPEGPALQLLRQYLPMRLFGGKGVVASAGRPWYDCENRWVPLAPQPRSRFVDSGAIVTPVLDGDEPGCVWHRLLLDAALPPGTSLAVWSRAANEQDTLAIAAWRPEPQPRARRSGPEIPFVDIGAYASHELLFQAAKGRFLQVKIELIGDGRASPRLRSLRAWFPRFSYLNRYLPAVYREDAASASFLDRYLANVEGVSTAIEDRIAAAQVLLRPDTVPADALDWLAHFFDLALDPLWDERRRRLFLANAMRFFQTRGTIRGLEIALRFALDPCVADDVFEKTRPRAVATARLVESYRTRRTPGVVFGDPTDLAPVRVVTGTAKWTPDQGRDALDAGYALYLQGLGLAASTYPILDPGSGLSRAWQDFSRAVLGFVPAVPERRRWQAFLAHRYPNPGAVTAAHKSQEAAPDDFSGFAPPPGPELPADGAEIVDWFQFQSVVVPMGRKAHRFSVLLPWPLYVLDSAGHGLDHVQLKKLASRVVDLQKPAHTVFDVKFFWAAFRIGEARLGDDTLLASGSRVPELIEPAVLGRDYVGSATLAGPLPSNEIRRTPSEPQEEAP
jgi:phage tail-like protein